MNRRDYRGITRSFNATQVRIKLKTGGEFEKYYPGKLNRKEVEKLLRLENYYLQVAETDVQWVKIRCMQSIKDFIDRSEIEILEENEKLI